MGIVIGYGLARYFGKIHMRDTAKVLLLLSIAFLLVSAEDRFTDILPFSALIAVMCIGTVSYTHLDVYKRQPHASG